MTDASALAHLVKEVAPDEIYNLAAQARPPCFPVYPRFPLFFLCRQSHVAVSFLCPAYTSDVAAGGVLNVLEAVRLAGREKSTRVYQARRPRTTTP